MSLALLLLFALLHSLVDADLKAWAAGIAVLCFTYLIRAGGTVLAVNGWPVAFGFQW
jgi:hypothetical protein